MDLKKCKEPLCEPVEQVRGKMGRGDYFDVSAHLHDVPVDLIHPIVARENYHEKVELHDENRDDFRVICRHCGKTTGWNKADAPGMPGAGADYTRNKWNQNA